MIGSIEATTTLTITGRTYSMKLFGEQYLKGKVWFSTSEDKGTTFFISVPLAYEEV